VSIIINKNTRVVVQGITGKEGTFHTTEMIKYGTNVVAGVTPNKGGQMAINNTIPVYNNVKEAKDITNANASIIFVPPRFAAAAIIEAAEAQIETIVCISEGIPIQDMIKAKNIVDKNNICLIGPNCPGIITVDECKLGIMPGFITKKGSVGVISKSGTLTYEAIDQLVKNGLGQTTALGIGGDPIIGTDMKTAMKLFEQDPETKGIVIIGEIGGTMEIDTAQWCKKNVKKPIVGFIAGQTAPA
jgi:succinyl-CoA synthetase alpha subunit